MPTVCDWVLATLMIAAYSAALVWVDPLSLIADWWNDR